MASLTRQPAQRRQVNLRSVALPTEHGGWGFVLEPIVLGLLVAWSLPGAAVALAMLALFLLHQPLKLALKDNLKRRRVSRTAYAERFALLYGAVSAAALLAALLTAAPAFLIPLALALPLMLVRLAHDARSQSRGLPAELGGAAALGATAAAIAVAGGWALPAALALWLLMAVRAVTSVLYVRQRLRLERDMPGHLRLVYVAHGAGAAAVAAVVLAGAAPWTALAAYALLVARAALGLSARRAPTTAKQTGLREMAYGLLYALIVGVGYIV